MEIYRATASTSKASHIGYSFCTGTFRKKMRGNNRSF